MGEQLRDELVQHAARLTDLFRQWDHWNEGSDGSVSKSEFRRAMVQVGLCVPRVEVSARSYMEGTMQPTYGGPATLYS